jgi:sulfite dehydrogenase (cytochrome) subunit B
MNKLMNAAAVAAGIAAIAGSLPSLAAGTVGTVRVELPAETAQFKPGPGVDAARQYCVICHSADYVYMQPPLSEEKWRAVVTKMQKVMGAPIPDSDIDVLAKYLASQNGKK